MDGASKFVRGEAVAAMIIIMINIGGGFIIGVFQQNLPLLTAAQTYTVLTIGDALVAQIPALIISTAAGLIVSRAASEQSMGKELTEQFRVQPQVIALSSGILFALGLIPGLPHLPFIMLSVAAGCFGSFHLPGARKSRPRRKMEESQKAAAARSRPNRWKPY